MDKKRIVAWIIYMFFVFLFWNIFDFLIVTFITKGTYSFTAFGDAFTPTLLGLVSGYYFIYKKE